VNPKKDVVLHHLRIALHGFALDNTKAKLVWEGRAQSSANHYRGARFHSPILLSRLLSMNFRRQRRPVHPIALGQEDGANSLEETPFHRFSNISARKRQAKGMEGDCGSGFCPRRHFAESRASPLLNAAKARTRPMLLPR